LAGLGIGRFRRAERRFDEFVAHDPEKWEPVFGKDHAPTKDDAMKRSAQIGLLVMGALTTTSAAGYFAHNHEQTCQARAADNPQQQSQQDCGRSVWHGSGGHGSAGSHAFYGSSSSSQSSSGTSGQSSSGTSSAARGGFGGHAGHGGGSSS
jgi:hypothetical protein